MSDARTQPVELNLERSRQLTIRWADGHQSVIPLRELRRACPCASCRAARDQQERDPLAVVQPVDSLEESLTVDSAELAGNYALRIRWKDGHDTGLYDFALLRSLGC